MLIFAIIKIVYYSTECTFGSWGGLTLQEALEMSYIEEVKEIFIEPPDSNVLAEEEPADEDDGGTLWQIERKAASIQIGRDKVIEFGQS